MRRIAIQILLLASLLVAPAQGEEAGALDRVDQQLGYSIGFQVGSDFRRSQTAIDPDLLIEGLRHALEGSAPRLTSSEMGEALKVLQDATRGDGAPAEERPPAP
jgi:hypothetical protein